MGRYAHSEKQLRRTAASIHGSIFQWYEGKAKGAVHSCFSGWKHASILGREARQRDRAVEDLNKQHQMELDEARRQADAKIQDGWEAIQAHHAKARADLEVVLA